MGEKVDEDELIRLVQDEAMQLADMNIAVAGLAGRFPKSDSVAEFEENLYEGVDMVNEQDNSRFTCGLWGLPPRAGRLKDLSRFDSEFFGFTSTEANYIDFQLRILYEVVYESIIDAGVNPSALRGSNTGVFFGLHCNEFENAMADDPNFKTNGYYAQYAVKIAQYFDLRGLTVTFDAACASGFVGLHNAVEALSAGLIEQAIVCSCNIPIHPTGSFIFLQMQMLSPTGYSRFLDARADGYVKSEACVSVLLQRKSLALRNYASIMATMTSVDGFKREGITFPSDRSQERLIRAAKELAGLSTNHIEYLEAHGTGTPAGDPQEVRAIANVYFPSEPDQRVQLHNPEAPDFEGELEPEVAGERRIIGPLLVGSVKTNMGHSEAASGLCALAKALLMLENELIYRGLHYEQPNSNIEALMDGKLKFVAETTRLRGKIIPLSCYGFGGSNVHAIVRANEQPAIDFDHSNSESLSEQPIRLIEMFGRNERTLNEMFDHILNKQQLRGARHCLSEDFLVLLDSLNAHPIDRMMNYRGYMLVDRSGQLELARNIKRCDLPTKSISDHDKLDIGRRGHLQDCKERRCHLILPGLGCQWPSMAAGLREFQPFWATIERLASILEPLLSGEQELQLERLLTSEEPLASMTAKFVAIAAYQIALINIVRDQLKVNNLCSIVGHSLGEILASYAAGLMDERETILVAFRLGKTLDDNLRSIKGRMVAVLGLSLEQMERRLDEIRQRNADSQLEVCCINGYNSLTVSGRQQEIELLCEELKQDDLFFKVVEDSVALHNSRIMGTQIRDKLKAAVEIVLFAGRTDLERPVSWISSVHAEISANNRQANAQFYADSLCCRVDFGGAIEQLEIDSICLELGPSAPFESQLRSMRQPDGGNKFHHAKLMRASLGQEEQKVFLLKQIGELYLLGARMNLIQFYHGIERLQKPVRRQTPSLSSLFKWDHEQELFVPRYPIQFSKSSAKCEMPVDIVQDRDKYYTDHCIEGRVLYPATGYLFLIWRVFSFTQRKIFDACFHDVEHELVPIEFHNVRLLRAIILGNRSAQIYIHMEEGTGRFEIKEGGSVVVEGYARTPSENPRGLLYENVKEKIRDEKLELSLTLDDVYKQFRVSGYDYGPTFRNIESASPDGRHCRVKYNGHFVALTDSILQSIFLAIAQYAPSGGLFLPTCFEYARFQPEPILSKIREAKMKFDLGDGSLNTKEKREIMTKIMQRESSRAEGGGADSQEADAAELAAAAAEQPSAEEKAEPCYFETFCDPVTGIIITDGIEMRGIKASPAPRRGDNNEALLESYQFVVDFETPIEDEHLTRFQSTIGVYTRVCDSMSARLLRKLQQVNERRERSEDKTADARDELERAYLAAHKLAQPGEEHYEIKKNGDKMLLSVLAELLQAEAGGKPRQLRELVQKHRFHLMGDLIQSSFTSERLMRPLVETVIENCCTRKRRLKLLEINSDDGILRGPLSELIQSVEPELSLDYALAHPDPSRLSTSKILNSNSTSSASGALKTYTLRDVQSLCAEQNLKELDAIVYKDISCYSLPKQLVEQNGLAPILTSLNGAIKRGGYVLLLMRQSLTLAERVLLALSEPQLVGLSKRNLAQMEKSSTLMARIDAINCILGARCKQMLDEAERNKMICVAKKRDLNGCTALLFRSTLEAQTASESITSTSMSDAEQEAAAQVERILLSVSHADTESVAGWLERLKDCFKQPPAAAEAAAAVADEGPEQKADEPAVSRRKVVWLCAAATKQQPISGLIGMMQALRKELGSDSLRCYYDEHSFKHLDEPRVDETQIEACAKFQEALRRDQIWNCVDSRGQFGSFRHFTINHYMSYQECRCDHLALAELDAEPEIASVPTSTTAVPVLRQETKPTFVNIMTRGDLSSFSWCEAPFAQLSSEERENIVQVAYSALNFRDIMLATGRLPLDALPLKLALSDCHLGLEFSGVTRAGKRVVGMVASGGIATHALCSGANSLKLEIPDWISLKEAATIPVVYATAIMALSYRGQMKRGESVLIHAGSGGVGQAAIRLAAHAGLTIFTTVGSDEKRQFLLDEFPNCLSDDRIFSSRDCNFEWRIMEATKGRGVDLVLNSLADEKLQASVRCLAEGGRFLEIGKYDMSTNARLELMLLDTNKTFHGILLDKMFDVDDRGGPGFERQLEGIGETLRDGLWRGYIKPIKSTVFGADQLEEAFRFMATGKHIGKVLIEIDPSLEETTLKDAALATTTTTTTRVPRPRKCVPRFQLSPQKSYIVTGGLGGFGLELVKWLVGRGARNLLLTSRQGLKTGYQKASLARLSAGEGARFLIVTETMADTTTARGVEQLYEMALEMAPSNQVGGIFHLAMVLKDSLLENMSAADFELVCRPKVNTCVHLDEISRRLRLRLDYFVCFSSITSGKGNAGQLNYAYANSCLERICERRRASVPQEHALAIQWGAIGDVGVAFENLGGNNVVIGGTVPQRMPSCLATLARLLSGPFVTCLSVLPVSRRSADAAGERGDLVAAITHVLGIKDASKVSEKATLGELGLDSLMAVEIRQYIEREYDMTLNIQEIRSLTIAQIREIGEREPRAKGAKRAEEPPSSSAAAAVATTNELNGNTDKASEAGTHQQQQQVSQGYGNAAKVAAQNKLANEAIEAMLDKSMVTSFVPQLKLPKCDYRRLNYVFGRSQNGLANGTKRSNGVSAHPSSADHLSRPIFFIPPIHGEFNRLEMICADIERPCIGLNWTRKLGRAETIEQVCETYLELLERADWRAEFCLDSDAVADEEKQNGASIRRVDLVGYSYGATIAFETMLRLHADGGRKFASLRPGELILLDGSPRQIELGSQYLSNLTRRKPMELGEKMDELLMVYLLAHTRRRTTVDYVGFQRSLAERSDAAEKIKFASERLFQYVDSRHNSLSEIADAMEAFCRRYELVSHYKTSSRLPTSCTLIRAEKIYLRAAAKEEDKEAAGSNRESHYDEDLGLSSVVEGKVHLFVMRGDHETFLEENRRQISRAIVKHCRGGATARA